MHNIGAETITDSDIVVKDPVAGNESAPEEEAVTERATDETIS